MRSRIFFAFLLSALIACVAIAGCSSSSQSSSAPASGPADLGISNGEYEVDVATDSSMFHLNETADGKATLTVTNEGATVHMTLVSKRIINLYAGTVEQAEADEAGWIQPTTDTVTYDDGYTEEVYGFDVPVPVLDEPFDVAILGVKGKWYDHTVTVSSPNDK